MRAARRPSRPTPPAYKRGLEALERCGNAHAAQRRELQRLLRLTRYEPLPEMTAIPTWLWRKLPRATQIGVAVAGVLALVAVAVATPEVIRSQRERSRAKDRRERREHAAVLASINAEQRPRPGRGPAAGGDPVARARLLHAVTSTVRLEAGRRGDPTLRVECEPHGPGGAGPSRALRSPPTHRRRRQAQGLPYRVKITLATGRFAYCRVSPRAAKSRGETPLSPECSGVDPP